MAQDVNPDHIADELETYKEKTEEKVEIYAENSEKVETELEKVEIDALINRLDREQRLIARALARGDQKVGDLAKDIGRTTHTINNWIKDGQPMSLLGITKKGVGVLTWPNPVKVPLD